MNLLRAFVNSACVGVGGNISKRTLLYITFARSIVQWVQKERHDNFRMDRVDFRMVTTLALTRGRLLNQNQSLNELQMSASTLSATHCVERKRSVQSIPIDRKINSGQSHFFVGRFNLKIARRAQSWPVFVPKPEADSVINVGWHPVMLPLEVQ